MKELRRNMRLIGVLLLCLFLFVAGWFSVTVYTQGSRWITTQYNRRLTTAKKTVAMGSVTDRNGVTLASTDAEGNRAYAASPIVRRALSQTVGDPLSMSGTGVETFHANILLGLSGSIIDRAWQWVSGEQTRGDDIRLTIDSRLSQYIAEQFPEGYVGAAAVINYQTGEVLSMVSFPNYDPEQVESRSVVETAYLNRCLQGQYAPGSVFKIVTLASALENKTGVSNVLYSCEGSRLFDNVPVTCAGGTVHGEMSLKQAFMKSCNITFAQLSYELGASTLQKTAEAFGFNDNFQFQDLILYQSTFPSDISTVGELAWSGVGQGRVLVTPLHMAMIAGAIGNDGLMMKPTLIAQVSGSSGISRLRTAGGVYRRAVSQSTADVIVDYMYAAVESGTGTRAQVSGHKICGKTGSAETSDDKTVPTNAWFVGFVDEPEHPYAVAVVVEEGGSGGDKAARLGGKTLAKAIELLG